MWVNFNSMFNAVWSCLWAWLMAGLCFLLVYEVAT